jgi:hypothetical protein
MVRTVRRATLRYLLQCGALAAALRPASSAAQSVPTETAAADLILARDLGNQGLALATKGDCAGAIDPLARSEALHHAPTTLTVLGDCHIAEGALVQGVGELTRVVREDLGPQGPPAYRAAQDRARQHLAEAWPRVPMLKILVNGVAPGLPLTLTLDGEPVASASLGIDRPVDPHAHTVEASAAGYRTAHQEVTLREAETRTLVVTLERLPATAPDDSWAAGRVPEPAGGTPEMPPLPSRRANYVPAGVAFGVGALGLSVGAVLGAVTLGKTSSLNDVCPTRSTCPASAQSDITDARTTATLSTVGFGVAAAGALLGVFWLVRPPSSGSTAAAEAPFRIATPWAGPHSVGVEGTF